MISKQKFRFFFFYYHNHEALPHHTFIHKRLSLALGAFFSVLPDERPKYIFITRHLSYNYPEMAAEDEGTSNAPQVKPEAGGADGGPASSEHLNIKVTDNNNEVFFRIRKSTQLKKLIDTFCERQGKSRSSVRFLYDGERVNESDTPDAVCSWRQSL